MSREDYEVVIGLEIHAELKTKTKLFCSCKNEFGGEPNTHCCPVCMAMPGALPVINKTAVEYAVKAGLATGCSIEKIVKMIEKIIFIQILQEHIKFLNLISLYVIMVLLKLKMKMVIKRKLEF